MVRRPSKIEWAMSLALATARRSTCLRRSVGCVLLNEWGQVLSTGYNGVAAGLPHCNEVKLEGADYKQWGDDPAVQKPERMIETYPHACAGANLPSGEGLELCEAIHAEQNALLQCRDVHEIAVCVTTVAPCVTCTKLLLNTSCHSIFFERMYSKAQMNMSRELWELKARRNWIGAADYIATRENL